MQEHSLPPRCSAGPEPIKSPGARSDQSLGFPDMTTWIIGDVHGCAAELAELLKHLTPGRDDRLLSCGDLLHRGPDPLGVIDLMEAHGRRRAELRRVAQAGELRAGPPSLAALGAGPHFAIRTRLAPASTGWRDSVPSGQRTSRVSGPCALPKKSSAED